MDANDVKNLKVHQVSNAEKNVENELANFFAVIFNSIREENPAAQALMAIEASAHLDLIHCILDTVVQGVTPEVGSWKHLTDEQILDATPAALGHIMAGLEEALETVKEPRLTALLEKVTQRLAETEEVLLEVK